MKRPCPSARDRSSPGRITAIAAEGRPGRREFHVLLHVSGRAGGTLYARVRGSVQTASGPHSRDALEVRQAVRPAEHAGAPQCQRSRGANRDLRGSVTALLPPADPHAVQISQLLSLPPAADIDPSSAAAGRPRQGGLPPSPR